MLFTEPDTYKEKNPTPKPESSLCVTIVAHLASSKRQKRRSFLSKKTEEGDGLH